MEILEIKLYLLFSYKFVLTNLVPTRQVNTWLNNDQGASVKSVTW